MKKCSDCNKPLKTSKDIARTAYGYSNCLECSEKYIGQKKGLLQEDGSVLLMSENDLNNLKAVELAFKKERAKYRNQE